MKRFLYVLLIVSIPNISNAMLGRTHYPDANKDGYGPYYRPKQFAADMNQPCDGGQCGCTVRWCWGYQYSDSKAGDPWCYKQLFGVPKGQAAWSECSEDSDCKRGMTCGSASNQFFFGKDPEHFIYVPENELVADTASKQEKDLAIVNMRAQNAIHVSKLKFEKKLKELEDKYNQLLYQQTEQARQERERTKALIRDICDIAGLRVPDAYRE